MAWPLLIFLLLPALTRAEIAFQAWVQRYNGPADGDDLAYAVAVDASNNVVVAGFSLGSGSGYDYATIKYSAAGLPLWTNRYNGPGNGDDLAGRVAVDGSNNVIVTGQSVGNGADYDYATIKYSAAGLPLWTNRYNGPYGNDYATALAVDGSNNVIVTGYSYSSGSSADWATIKYSSAGVPLWINRYGNGWPYAVAVDSSNNVIVTGWSGSGYATLKYSSTGVSLWTNAYSVPGVNQANAIAVDGSNNVIVTGVSGDYPAWYYATIKYSSAGVPLWTNRYNGLRDGLDWATDVAVDGSNNVIVTGRSVGSGSGYDYATVKYSTAGLPLWTNRYSGGSANALAVDSRNNVIVTGSIDTSENYDDYATIKYSSAGVPLWTNRYNGPGDYYAQAQALALDHNGNVIVTGCSAGAGHNNDFATVKYVSLASPRLTGLQLTNGVFQLRVDDVLQPGTLVIEASTSLAGWVPVFTNTAPTSVLFYTDPDATHQPTRFYRAFQFP